MEEIWRDVVGFEEFFKVSNLGKVFSKRTDKVLVQTISKTGYKVLSTRIGGRKGKCYCFRIHVLVAKAFLRNEFNKPYVNHIDGVKINNEISNLEWCTAKENMEHAYKIGLVPKKTSIPSPQRKLSKEDCEYIKNNYQPKHKEFGARALGRKFLVDKNSITDIYNGRSYCI